MTSFDVFPLRLSFFLKNVTDRWIIQVTSMTGGGKVKKVLSSLESGRRGGILILQKLEEKSVSKASHLLTRVRKFIYSLPSCYPCAGLLWSCGETMTAYWGSNTATLDILIIRAPPAFFPISCCPATGEADPRYSVCVCGISGGGVQIRLCV